MATGDFYTISPGVCALCKKPLRGKGHTVGGVLNHGRGDHMERLPTPVEVRAGVCDQCFEINFTEPKVSIGVADGD